MSRRRGMLCVLVVMALAAIGCDEFGHSGGPRGVNTADKSWTVDQ